MSAETHTAFTSALLAIDSVTDRDIVTRSCLNSCVSLPLVYSVLSVHLEIKNSTCFAFLANVYMLSPVVCLSVTRVNPTQSVVIFGNISTEFVTLAIRWHPQKILRRSSQGNPSAGGVKHNIAILDLSKAISWKQCKVGGKLVLITNRKSHMSFRLVPKSVTLNDLERCNGRYFSLFQRTRVRCRRKTITSVSKSTFNSLRPY